MTINYFFNHHFGGQILACCLHGARGRFQLQLKTMNSPQLHSHSLIKVTRSIKRVDTCMHSEIDCEMVQFF